MAYQTEPLEYPSENYRGLKRTLKTEVSAAALSFGELHLSEIQLMKWLLIYDFDRVSEITGSGDNRDFVRFCEWVSVAGWKEFYIGFYLDL